MGRHCAFRPGRSGGGGPPFPRSPGAPRLSYQGDRGGEPGKGRRWLTGASPVRTPFLRFPHLWAASGFAGEADAAAPGTPPPQVIYQL